MECPECKQVYFLNPAVGVGAFILDERGRLLVVGRVHDPQKGFWDLPGGFVDFGESAEVALAREIREETNLVMTKSEYLCSFPNQYAYRGVLYHVMDVFFVCQVASLTPLHAADDAEFPEFVDIPSMNIERLAFPSTRFAAKRLQERYSYVSPSGGPSPASVS